LGWEEGMNKSVRGIILAAGLLCLIGFFFFRFNGVSASAGKGTDASVPGFSLVLGLPFSPWLSVERNLPQVDGSFHSDTKVIPVSLSWIALVAGVALIAVQRRALAAEQASG
jgi:hypothetical protein